MYNNNNNVIILDAGHGGINPSTGRYVTPGKRSPIWNDGSQYFEGVGNREIVIITSQYLRSLGYIVEYTVDPKGWLDTPLRERIRRSNEIYEKYPNAFQISIHSNGFINESANGAEVYTSIGETKSDTLATIFINEYKKQFQDIKIRSDYRDGDVDKESHLAMNKVKCPSILIESMFHTNERECKILMSREGKEKIAISITETAILYNQ